MRRTTVGLVIIAALGVSAALLSATLLSSYTRPPEKMPRIGVVGSASPSTVPHIIEAFRQGLRELGYLEGQNIATEYRFAGDRVDQLPDLAGELVRLKVRVIVAGGNEAVRAANETTTGIPIVMAVSNDAVGTGLVDSLARPGRNVTGLTSPSPELSAKRLELLKEAVPGVTRVAVLWNPVHPLADRTLRETEVAARSLGVQLQVVEVRDPGEFESAFTAMARERAGAVVVLGHPMFIGAKGYRSPLLCCAVMLRARRLFVSVSLDAEIVTPSIVSWSQRRTAASASSCFSKFT
jgi:putative ABC transport system substrate-binding protein